MTMMPTLNDSTAEEGEEFIINNENDEEAVDGDDGDEVSMLKNHKAPANINVFSGFAWSGW